MSDRIGEMIAEERLIAVRPSGARLKVPAAVGQPYQVGPQEWACPVSLAGLYEKLVDVHGSSSLQALCLAASYLRRLLVYFLEDGGGLLYEDGSDDFDIASCFSDVGEGIPVRFT
jgi:hypothetical protein